MNLATYLDRATRAAPDRITIQLGDTRLTYRQLAYSSAPFAGFLRDRGLRPGDRVAVWMPNRLEYLPAVFGTWKAGVVGVPLNCKPGVTPQDIAAFCGTHPDVQSLHRPRRIELVDALPRTGSGKLDRPSVRRMFKEPAAG